MPFKIKQLRSKLNITQLELAEKAEISQCYLSQLESGIKNPSFKVLKRIAEALGVDLSELLKKEDQPA